MCHFKIAPATLFILTFVPVLSFSPLRVEGKSAQQIWDHVQREAEWQKSEAAPTGQSIPATTKVEWKDMREGFKQLNERLLLGGYREHGQHDPAWDADAETFITGVLAYFDDRENDRLEPLAKSGKEILSRGCRDPLILYLTGVMFEFNGDAHEAKKLFLQAAAEYDHSTYPAYNRVWLAHHLQDIYSSHGSIHQINAADWANRMRSLVPMAINGGTYLPGEERLAMTHLMDHWLEGLDTEATKEIIDQISMSDQVNEYVKLVVNGRLYVTFAWKARGGGWANSVSEQGWEGFEKNLTIARDLFVKAWTEYPEFPEAPAEMIQVTMAGHGVSNENERVWFDRAVAAQFDYGGAYNKYLWAIRPRWGGSFQQMMAFGLECFDTGRFDTEIPFYLYRVLEDMDIDDEEGARRYWQRSEVASRLQKLFEEYPLGTPKDSPYKVTMRLGCAWKSGLDDIVESILSSQREVIDTVRLQNAFGITIDQLSLESELRKRGTESALAEADRLARGTNAILAAEKYRELMKVHEEDRVVKVLLERRLALLACVEELNSGEWIDVMKDERSSAVWRPRKGKWSIEENGRRFRGISSSDGLMLDLMADIPRPFSVRGEFTFVKSNYRGSFNGGLLFASPNKLNPDEIIGLGIYKQENQLKWNGKLDGSWLKDEVEGQLPVDHTNVFEYVVGKKDIQLVLNGQPVTVPWPKNVHRPLPHLQFGIGGGYWYADSELTFSNISVRILDKKYQAKPVFRDGLGFELDAAPQN